MVVRMNGFGKHRNLAASAHELQRAAGHIQRNAARADAVQTLPTALAHMEEALERLSTAANVAARAVEEYDARAGADPDVLRRARALRWHLAHLAARLRGASDACPDTRRWARELIREPSRPAAPEPFGPAPVDEPDELAAAAASARTM
jgi:hypothetical protein